ncbi:hypothetical protein SCD_n01214 [Sulfuricella denitrificans skB26]|uniref:Uncharacterized protein n=1 Tax=Sulfuricella denitrificans (strain DSM 22764 / NBRC 105220 / skB26) TaxID=1163617 RepID=S6ABV6_SULDS|nr:hypothetical protein [Sulfuricella denitrificans]BAN35043.1 hypothetical protein SCD_n01214 [Sulfuricella denitrificans skB26]
MLLTPENPQEIATELESRIAKLAGRAIDSSAPGNSKAPLPRLNAGLARESVGITPAQPKADPSLSSIEADFPHIAEKLVLVWGHPGCFSYLSELIIDNRGNRKGFDLDIMGDLMLLLKITEQVPPDQWASAPGRHR